MGGIEANSTLVERYLQLLKDKKVKGTLFLQQTYIDDKERDLNKATAE